MTQYIRTSGVRAGISIACATFLVTLLATGTWAQTGRISGKVIDKDTGDPLVNTNVEIVSPDLKTKLGTTSNTEGGYTIDVPPGAYTVKATFVGYRAAAVRSVVVTAGESAEVSFEMEIVLYEFDEVVVSASRREQSIVDAPLSIAKIDAQEMQSNTVIGSYKSAIKNLKGVDRFQTGIFSERISIRGFNQALSTRGLLLIDGRFTFQPSGSGGPGDLHIVAKDDYQDIEVIIGPGAALYGPDAVSSVISVTTKDPRVQPGTTFSLSGGSRNLFRGRFYHGERQGHWGWKVSGEYQRGVDYKLTNTFYNADSSASVTDNPDFDASNLRGGVGLFYYPDETSSLRFAAGAAITNAINITSTTRSQLVDTGYDYQQLTYTSPHMYLNLYRTGDDTGDSFALDTRAENLLTGLSPAEAREQATFTGQSSFWEAEGRVFSNLPHLKNTRFTLGANFRQHRPNSSLLNVTGGVNQGGMYGHAETDLGEMFRLVLASRVDFYEVYDTQVSPKVALIYKPRADAAIRATYNRAYKSPTAFHQHLFFQIQPGVVGRGNFKGFRFGNLNGDPLPPQFANGISGLLPEENSTFEIGYKGVVANRVFLDIDGYRSRYRNFISPIGFIGNLHLGGGVVILDEDGDPRPEVTLTYQNFGRRTVLGFDVGVDVQATDRVMLKANLTFIEPGDLEDAGGVDQPFNTPRTISNFGLSASDFLSKGTSLDVSLRHVEEFDFSSGIHVGTVPAYTVVDLNLGYRTAYGVTYRLSASNVLGNNHIEIIDGPKLGRMVVSEVQYGF
jgi:outer membrane receptor for ferrienterochelin and colicins